MTALLGLDSSATAAARAVPYDWDGELQRGGTIVVAERLRSLGVTAAGAPASSLDEAGAFVSANLGLTEHAGAWCFVQSPEAA